MSDLEFFKKWGWQKITSVYGMRPNPFGNGKDEFHQGIDLVKEKNGNVPAFTDGTVLFAGEGISGSGVGGYGNVVVVKDKNGCVQVYAHLTSVKVKKGDKVEEGDIVGTQGNTGRSSGQHLHFEVRKKDGAGYGFNADKQAGTHEPVAYLKKYLGDDAPAAKPAAKFVAKEDGEPKKRKTYVIKGGDTLSSIAKAYGHTVNELMELNPKVTNASKIKAGDVLYVE